MEVIFDRANRLYRIGEEITGRVVITGGSLFTLEDLEIRYGWRTHGKGDRDKGPEYTELLSTDALPFGEGEHREFTFRFAAPPGPVTYHGHHLNVDWYLKAYARGRHFEHIEAEEDFLLQSGPLSGGIVLGTKEIAFNQIPQPLPQESPWRLDVVEANALDVDQGSGIRILEAAWAVFLVLWFLSMVGALLWAMMFHGPRAAWIYGFAAIAITALGFVIHDNAYRRKLAVKEACVEPGITYAGSRTDCRLEFQVKRDVYLHKIEARIASEERATQGSGTTATTATHELYSVRFGRQFNERLLSGRVISFECPLPIPADAPASFTSAKNAVEWFVDLKLELKGWPGLQKHFPITVLPGGCAPGE